MFLLILQYIIFTSKAAVKVICFSLKGILITFDHERYCQCEMYNNKLVKTILPFYLGIRNTRLLLLLTSLVGYHVFASHNFVWENGFMCAYNRMNIKIIVRSVKKVEACCYVTLVLCHFTWDVLILHLMNHHRDAGVVLFV